MLANMKPRSACLCVLTSIALSSTAKAEAPALQTPAPFIHLADNLDEVDALGWCIDTLGRGFSEQLQAHSCKPQGGDVQFSFDGETGQIQSVEFAGKCMTLSEPENEAVPFGLKDCLENEASQQFAYAAETMQFTLVGEETQCVSVADTSRSAGPFMSRDLKLTPCASTDPIFKQWIIKSS
ncbi:ricin-type beta-trefoil lectin domain protein [Pararhizobium sp. IMCC21322]|uniref:ricin-type beta-trefoil lectin domain protein n=1 Tax=Pararhizobium sp. IMCC21322 TaxID=3067903 RepID=UPI002740E67B|nr:ricin-type beta-trefoil lectin domain protein [Pararhizobium sp. IMCC21322]